MPFFKKSEIAKGKEPPSLVARCGTCGLYKGCQQPKWAPVGEGAKGILIIGTAPTTWEDGEGTQLLGDYGSYFRKVLGSYGVQVERDCWVTNALRCGTEKPMLENVEHCRPYLKQVVEQLQPTTILVLGEFAMLACLPLIWKSRDITSILTWAGWRIPSQTINAWVCPTYHPNHVQRLLKREDKLANVTRLHFEHHIARALARRGKPWAPVPQWGEDVEHVTNTRQAIAYLRHVCNKGGLTAFDYECTTKKPDNALTRDVVTCAVCWRGRRTFAFDYTPAVRDAWLDYLRSPVPKVASNLKY